MKKLAYTYLLVFHFLSSATSQTSSYYTPTGSTTYSASSSIPPWYANLEKYWFYRYRLVEDFMLIGDGPGMSIPAQSRALDSDNRTGGFYDERNTLAWSDATIDLGHYISALAAEDKLLSAFNYSVTRTQYELLHALNAFERLDNDAEQYEYQVNGNLDIYHGYPGTLTGYSFDPSSHLREP